jgi:DNA topoisomerase-2
MAQNFVGSNNIQILKPNGQFGTRCNPKKDAASPRYIWTKLEDLTPLIFNKMDEPVLNKQDDDGLPIEPEYYAPIIPMILINGAEGIGTGFSTYIPPYNPLDVLKNIQLKLKGKPMKDIDPWYQGFNGIISKIDEQSYEVYGTWSVKGNKVIIDELPVGTWTTNYCEFLEKLLDNTSDTKKDVKKTKEKKTKEKESNPFLSYTKANTDTKVHFELTFEDGFLENCKNLDKMLKLVTTFKISNMHLYGPEGSIKRYDNVAQIIEDYYQVRLELFAKRKQLQLEVLEHQLALISWKVKFILMVIAGKIEVNNKKRILIEENLEKLKFPRLSVNIESNKSYDYLLSMPIYNLTYEKIQELKKQEKEKQTEYDDLSAKSPEDIWNSELEILKERYEKWYKAQQEEANKVVISKKTTKKTKK